jgi:hypothetical protein
MGVNHSHLPYLENGGGYERKERYRSDWGTAPRRSTVVSALIPPSVLEFYDRALTGDLGEAEASSWWRGGDPCWRALLTVDSSEAEAGMQVCCAASRCAARRCGP